MPIPKPGEDENKSDYMDRCIAFLVDEGRSVGVAYAICDAEWRNRDREEND